MKTIKDTPTGVDSPGTIVERMEQEWPEMTQEFKRLQSCLLYTSPSPRDVEESRMPSSA